MKIYQVAILAALALATATGSALAYDRIALSAGVGPSGYAQTPAQISNDLRNPHNMTYVPANQGG